MLKALLDFLSFYKERWAYGIMSLCLLPLSNFEPVNWFLMKHFIWAPCH